jgi:hypothetical protein
VWFRTILAGIARNVPAMQPLKSKVFCRFAHCSDSQNEVCFSLCFRLCFRLFSRSSSRLSSRLFPLLILSSASHCSITRICDKIDFNCLFPHRNDSSTYARLRRNVKRRIRRALGTLSEQTLSTSALDMSGVVSSPQDCLVPCGRFRATTSNVVHGRGLVAAIDIPANTNLFAIVGTLVNTRLPCNVDMSSYCWTTPGATVDYCQFFPSSCDASRFINASLSRISANCDVRWVRKVVPVLHSLRAIRAGEEILVFYRF